MLLLKSPAAIFLEISVSFLIGLVILLPMKYETTAANTRIIIIKITNVVIVE